MASTGKKIARIGWPSGVRQEAILPATISILWITLFVAPLLMHVLCYPLQSIGEVAVVGLAMMPGMLGLFVFGYRALYVSLYVLLNCSVAWPDDDSIYGFISSQRWIFPGRRNEGRSTTRMRMQSIAYISMVTICSALIGACAFTGLVAAIMGAPLIPSISSFRTTELVIVGLYVCIVMPLVETAAMAAILWFLTQKVELTHRKASFVSGCIWAALHLWINGAQTVPAIFWLFWLLSCLYLKVSEKGGARAIFTVAAVHAAYNGVLFTATYYLANFRCE